MWNCHIDLPFFVTQHTHEKMYECLCERVE